MHAAESLQSVEDAQWLANVAAESIGWQPLGDGAYLHLGDPDALVISVDIKDTHVSCLTI